MQMVSSPNIDMNIGLFEPFYMFPYEVTKLTVVVFFGWRLCMFFNCQARVQVPNPLSQKAPNPDSKVRPSLKNPILWTGLTQ